MTGAANHSLLKIVKAVCFASQRRSSVVKGYNIRRHYAKKHEYAKYN
jgi:hypothetical protein